MVEHMRTFDLEMYIFQISQPDGPSIVDHAEVDDMQSAQEPLDPNASFAYASTDGLLIKLVVAAQLRGRCLESETA